MFKAEEQKLKSLIDLEVYDLLKANKAIIAGGAITSLFTNKDVKDIDVYLPSQRAVVNILAEAFGQQGFTETNDYLAQFQLRYVNITDKSLMFKNNEQEVQLITFKYFDSAEEIFDTFDFTVCMGAYDLDKEEFIFHPEFMKHNAQRYLKFNTGTAFPLLSALRVDKYKDKGFEISKAEYLRVIFTCMSLDLSSWEDVKEHIGGMYGYNMDEFFDEEQEFSLPEVIKQMGGKQYGYNKYLTVEPDFIKVLNKFDPSEEIEIPEPPYKEGMFYKYVGKDLKSNMHHVKLDYSIGNIINGGEQGIYIHADPLNPWSTQGVCIELEPIGDYTIKGNSSNWDKKAQLFGDFRVTRIVPEWKEGLTKAEYKYLAHREKKNEQ